MAQGRAHLRREEAVNGFVDSGRVSAFEHGKPIVGGKEGIDWTQVAQSMATFAKMGVITLLQLHILEGHGTPLRDSLDKPAGPRYGFRSCDDKPLRSLFGVTPVTVRMYSATRLPWRARMAARAPSGVTMVTKPKARGF